MPADDTSYYGRARIVPAVAGASRPAQDSSQKLPDVTMLLRVKGSAPPSATALFRTQLNFALFPDQEWHWAIVRAKGMPPPPPPEAMTMMDPNPGPVQLPAVQPEPGPSGPPETLPPSDANPAVHQR